MNTAIYVICYNATSLCRRCSGCRLVRMELVVAGWLLLGGWLLAPATAVRCYTDLMKTKVTTYIACILI